MKKIFSVLVCLLLLLGLAACKQPASEESGQVSAEESGQEQNLPEIKDVTASASVDAFSVTVNGTEITNDMLSALKIYEISVSTVNSKGNTSEATYTGYRLSDVLAVCGVRNASELFSVANDGYINEMDAAAVLDEYTLLAVLKNGEPGSEGTVFLAPCRSTVSGDYHKLVVEINVK